MRGPGRYCRAMRILFAALRLVVAAGVTAAIIAQLALSISLWSEAGGNLGVYIQNFFSFFTIESNVLTVVVCLVGAVLLLARREGADPTWFNNLRPATATYMIVTPHEPGLLPRWLAEKGVTQIIAGGMGARAQQLFAERGIQVVTGAPADDPETLVKAFLSGTLVTGENACDH